MRRLSEKLMFDILGLKIEKLLSTLF